jgi:membrane protein implicated in regulation of membrane protease activity
VNKSFLIIGIPAFVVSFFWLTFGWGVRVALIVIGTELAAVAAGVLYIRRREKSATPR